MKMNKKIKLLETYLDYSKNWALGSLAAVLVSGLALLQINELYTKKWWTLVILLITFSLLTIHMTSRYESRQKELVKAIKEL